MLALVIYLAVAVVVFFTPMILGWQEAEMELPSVFVCALCWPVALPILLIVAIAINYEDLTSRVGEYWDHYREPKDQGDNTEHKG
jgi:hypothetical protein